MTQGLAATSTDMMAIASSSHSSAAAASPPRPPRPWLALPVATGPMRMSSSWSSDAPNDVGMCLRLSSLEPPPIFNCMQQYDLAGLVVRQLHHSSHSSCRAACRKDTACALYVLHTNATCSLRSRPFYVDPLLVDAKISGTMREDVLIACVHAQRLVPQRAPPDLVSPNRIVRMGADGLKRGTGVDMHVCIHVCVRCLDISWTATTRCMRLGWSTVRSPHLLVPLVQYIHTERIFTLLS